MDVLSFTSFREQAFQLDRLNTAVANASSLNASVTALSCLSPNVAHESYRWMCYDSPIDVACDNSNVLCVYDNTSFSANRCCQWTVPAGTTKARFEIWGPGSSGGSGGNCCGYTPWGTTGSFLAFTVNVTAGCQYTLCAGNSNCSLCMYCCGCTTYSDNGCYSSCCPSFVTGFGITTACAPGGRWDLRQNMAARWCSFGGACTNASCFIAPEALGGCGLVICQNGSTLCHGNSNTTCRTMRAQADWLVRPCACFSNCNVLTLSIPTMHQGGFVSSSNYGHATLLPPYPKCGWRADGTCSNVLPGGCFTEWSFSSQTCTTYGLSLSAHCCCMGHPGLGGSWGHVMGGCTSAYGGRGRAGMVKVIYC
jgi:hypothetical protein